MTNTSTPETRIVIKAGLIFTSRFDRPAHDFEYRITNVDGDHASFEWVNERGEHETNSGHINNMRSYFRANQWTFKRYDR